MKNLVKPIIIFGLGILARAVLKRYQPTIVMVTGSVGKTSTKDAVAAVLSKKFFVRKSEKSFNSEFGVPFTILGVDNPWRNPVAWLKVVKRGIALLLLPNHYPSMLVLEVGSGKPGDLAQILKIATPDAVVVTRLPEIPVHVEAYASPEAVQEEEFSPAYALLPAAPLIIPADDAYAVNSAVRISARVITYGHTSDASVRVGVPTFLEDKNEVVGMQAEVTTTDGSATVRVLGSVGATQALPAAAAIAAGSAFQIPLTEALAALEAYEPPPGRGRLLKGKNAAVIIDDSYNASPAAVEQALHTLKAFPRAKRRIAVLGDMLELGRYSVMEHERIGALARASADLLVAVGIRARGLVPAPDTPNTLLFDSAEAAAETLTEYLREGDVVLVKGSQSIRTERIVEALLADPTDARLLVRQEKAWKKR